MENIIKKTAFCFDLDGTITIEEVLPIIANKTNFSEEIEALTKATLSGALHFKQSFLLRCQLLKDVPIPVIHEIVRKVQLFNKLVDFINLYVDQCFVITGNLDCWIGPIIQKIGCKVLSSTALVEDNYIKHITSVLDKGDAIKHLRATTNFTDFVAIGDSFADVNMFNYADTKIAFGGTHMPVEALIAEADMLIFNEESLCRELSMLL